MGPATTEPCPPSPAATMLTDSDKKLVLQVWEKAIRHPDCGAEALERCGLSLGKPRARGATGWEPHRAAGGRLAGRQH